MKTILCILFVSFSLVLSVGCGGTAENTVKPAPEAPTDRDSMRKHYEDASKP